MGKLLRTIQVQLPFLQDAKFAVMREILNLLKVPIERDFEALAAFRPSDGALFLDVGANRGLSADAIRMQHAKVRIELFEPNELLCEKLRELFAGDSRITVHSFGLGDETTEGTLFVPFYKKWMFDGLASFKEPEASSWLRGKMYFYNERLLTLRKSTCKIARLDDLGLAPFFIKLDVQGYEYNALKGGEQTLKVHEPVLLIEAPDGRTNQLLASLRYVPYAYEGRKFRSGRQGSLNTFFMTTAKSSLVKEHIG
jgi:FkbM family methyltransferase